MAESQKMITLKSSDGEVFEVEESVALESSLIKNTIEDCAVNTITIPNVTGNILAKVIEYCKRHVDAAANKTVAETGDEKRVDDDLKDFDAEFVNVDHAANYMHITGLLELTIKAAADSVKDKTPEEIREIFNIVNDFTLEEEEAVRKENSWAFV